MMKRDWDLVFSEYNLGLRLEDQLNQVEDKVRTVDPVRFNTSTDDLLSATIASELVIAPVALNEDQLSVSSRDVSVDRVQRKTRLWTWRCLSQARIENMWSRSPSTSSISL